MHRQIVAEVQIARLERVVIGHRMFVQREPRVARSMSKKRCGLPMAATACTPAPRKLASARSDAPPETGRASPGRMFMTKCVRVTKRGSANPAR